MTSGPSHLGYVLKRFPRISETFVAAELLELRRQGQRVTVFALSKPDEPFAHRFLDELDVEVVYLPHRPGRQPGRTAAAACAIAARQPKGVVRAARSALSPPSVRGWRHLLQAAVLVRELRHAGVDHVHAHFASTAARLAQLGWYLGGPPYSVTAHAKDIYHCDVRPDRLASVLGDARFVATVSEANVRHLDGVLAGHGRRGPGHRGGVALVPNSVDLRRIPPVPRRPEPGLVLTVARMVEKKGTDDLVRACGLLGRQGVAVRLQLVGDGPLRPALEALARSEGVDARFLGPLDHDEVLARYGRASVFALPCVVAGTGDRDGLPTAVLEAMASSVPVVATGVNGLAEAVVDDRTGLTVPEHDPEALAAAIGRLLADPVLAERLGRAGRAHVAAGYSLAASTARLRTLFAAATAPRAAVPGDAAAGGRAA